MPKPSPKIVEIETHFSDMQAAATPDSSERAREAQKRIYLRYEGAIRRYLRSALPDATSAEEVFSDFADRLVNCRFAGFVPEKGRFRDYLKTILFRMVLDFNEKRGKSPSSILDPNGVADPSLELRENDSRYLTIWRESLMQRAFSEVMKWECATIRPYATIYWASMPSDARAMLSGGVTPILLGRFLGENVGTQRLSSAEIAAALARSMGAPVKEVWVNGLRKLARDAYEDSLLREVWDSIEAATFNRVEEELIDLGLHRPLKRAVERRRNGTSWQPVGSSRHPARVNTVVRSDSLARPSPRYRDISASAPRSLRPSPAPRSG